MPTVRMSNPSRTPRQWKYTYTQLDVPTIRHIGCFRPYLANIKTLRIWIDSCHSSILPYAYWHLEGVGGRRGMRVLVNNQGEVSLSVPDTNWSILNLLPPIKARRDIQLWIRLTSFLTAVILFLFRGRSSRILLSSSVQCLMYQIS